MVRSENTFSLVGIFNAKLKPRTCLVLVVAIVIVEFSIFKYFYPHASFIHGDSFSYIGAAARNSSINTYLIGYSKFLRLISVFSTSDIILVFIQFSLLIFSSLFLLSSLLLLYIPSKRIITILVAIILINPLYLYLGNLVSSDALFASLSFLWISFLIRIIHTPTLRLLILHAIVLLLLFTIRYNALIYVFISFVAFILADKSNKWKWIAFVASILLVSLFVLYTQFEYKKITGVRQYSPFAGWQLANNAMYTYRYVDKKLRDKVPDKFKALDSLICLYFDSTKDLRKFPVERIRAGSYYMWSTSLPLYRYRDQLLQGDSEKPEFIKWAKMGPLYKQYGSFIISKYPFHFYSHFIIPNSIRYFAPPIEFLKDYNSGTDTVMDIAKNWFKYRSNRIYSRSKIDFSRILEIYPVLSGIMNAIIMVALFFCLYVRAYRHSFYFFKCIILFFIFWVSNALFTIIASPAALRFQVFPIFLSFVFLTIIIDLIVKINEEDVGSKKIVAIEYLFKR